MLIYSFLVATISKRPFSFTMRNYILETAFKPFSVPVYPSTQSFLLSLEEMTFIEVTVFANSDTSSMIATFFVDFTLVNAVNKLILLYFV